MRPQRLIILGLAAAVVSAVLAYLLQGLVGGSRTGPGGQSVTGKCIVAARDLPVGHRIVAGDLEVVELSSRAEADVVSNPSLAIGRSTAGSLSKGQALRTADLVAPGSGSSIAAQLSPGMRAMTVSLRDTGPEVVLYPGAAVDVLATIERPGRAAGQRDSITLTLLQRVRVLAVNDDAVGSRPAREPTGERQPASRKLTVTLAVTPDQAAKVELASSRGTIGITLRSGDDGSDGAPEGATATAWSILGMPEAPPEAPTTPPQKQAAATNAPSEANPSPPPATQAPKPPAPVWRVNIVRGGIDRIDTVPDPKAGTEPQATRTP